MESVWFKLKHTHNVAPDVSKLGLTEETGPILLGHFIPDLNQLDYPINRGAILKFPEETMEVWPSKTVEFEWADSQSNHAGASGSVAVPTDATAGSTLKASARVAFQQSVENFVKFECLDCYIVNPTKKYVNNCIKTESIASHIAAGIPGTFKMFMITGIMIARGARTSHKQDKRSDTGVNAGFSISPLGAASGDGHLNKHSGHSQSGTSATDFVWAIRLARISKNLGELILCKDWSMVTETKGATFAPGSGKVDVAKVVTREGMTSYGQVIEDEETELAFVV